MRLLIAEGFLAVLGCLAQVPGVSGVPAITIPVGTKVELALTNPLWAKSVQLGDSVYSKTSFPVAVGDRIAIPPNTYVKGQIDIMTLPTSRSGHAEFRMHFTDIVFANGYTVNLPGDADADDAIATVNVAVSSRSDVVLDNGTQIEMVLERPLQLDADKVAAAVRQTKPLDLTQWKSATRCRPVPATEGTPDTVIPGTSGTPGTPSTVIPGGPGMPDTVIPGTPGTPGTPPTVIPGSPGTPGIACPGPPAVVYQPAEHKESFALREAVLVGGRQLPAGAYQAVWEGLGPATQVRIERKDKVAATVQARVVALGKKAPTTASVPHTNSDGSVSLESLQFAGQTFELRFGQ